jgi:DNA (cytosine-5)-methyltransferase 1
MISYEPLHKTLREKGLVLSEFRGDFLNPRTQANINANRPVNLTTIEKLCKELNVPIEKIVEIKF